MYRVDRRRRFAMLMALGLTLLLGTAIGLGVAIVNGRVPTPRLDVRYGAVRIVGYRTHAAARPPNTLCPLESGPHLHDHYVIWSINVPPTADQPYGGNAWCLLTVPSNIH